MARLARLSIGGLPHLILQRGAHGASLFRNDSDREHFLRVLLHACRDTALAVHGYALLPDAVYIVVTPPDARATGLTVQAVGRRYVRWFNDRNRRHGALFDGRFRSSVLDADTFLLPCLRFVETRPVAAGLVVDPFSFRWSSGRHHVGAAVDPLIEDPGAWWALGNTPFERQAKWREYVSLGPSQREAAQFSQSLLGGWALGSPAFLAEIGKAASRRASPEQSGRPRKVPEASKH